MSREAYAAAVEQLRDCWDALKVAAATLPEAPADGVCPECGGSDWQLVQLGYSASSSVEFQEAEAGADGAQDLRAAWVAWWDSDDMSDDGDGPAILQCTAFLDRDDPKRDNYERCLHLFAAPAGLLDWA